MDRENDNMPLHMVDSLEGLATAQKPKIPVDESVEKLSGILDELGERQARSLMGFRVVENTMLRGREHVLMVGSDLYRDILKLAAKDSLPRITEEIDMPSTTEHGANSQC